MFWLIALIVLVGFLYFGLTSYIYGNDDFWPKQGVPFGKGKELGTFWDRISFKTPFQELDNTFYTKFKKLKPSPKLIGIMEFRRPVAMILDPDLIKNIMVKDFDHFANRRDFGKKNDTTFSDKMLVNMKDQEWKDLRSTLSPTFTTGKIKNMFSVFTESSDKMSAFLRSEAEKSPEIDFRDVAGRYTMDVIASAAFGVDSQNFQDKNSRFAAMGLRIQKQFEGWVGLFKIFLAFMLPSVIEHLPLSVLDQTAFDFFQDVVRKTIKHRESTGERRNDFLQLLMETRNEAWNIAMDDDPDNATETPQPKSVKAVMTDELIEAQCMLFFLAGFDTTETLLIFAAYELALNPDIQKKLATELEAAIDKNGELNYETVNELEYLDMVISETLRKYPPAPRTERRCTEDYKVPSTNVELKKGQLIAIPIWAFHNDPELYPEPDKFLPERFTKENKNARNPYTYMPFGLGPRNCIAMRFAITEGKAAIAHLVRNFVLEPSARTLIPMKYQMGASMKPIDGMWLKVTPN